MWKRVCDYWMGYAFIFAFSAVMGFFASCLFFISWPIVFFLGMATAESFRYNARWFDKWPMTITIVIALFAGGLPLWLIGFGGLAWKWWNGLLGNLITSFLFLIGIFVYELVVFIRNRKGTGKPGDPPHNKSAFRRLISKQSPNDNVQRPFQRKILATT